MTRAFDRPLAEQWAERALANVARPYPFKLDQVLATERDIAAPARIHPAFWGSYDWHSSVHMHWTLARLMRRFPDHRLADATRRHFAERLTDSHIATELRAFQRPHQAGFERPYGWGWLLKLAAELDALAQEQAEARDPSVFLAPLAHEIADRLVDYLQRVYHPTRSGNHGNTAFALLLALDYCTQVQHRRLANLIVECTQRWFARDRRYPADYEPGGEDFLSPGLTEAALMRRALDSCSFADWWTQFEPAPPAMASWLTPVRVSDAADAKIVHLHGLNLSRAWCWRQLLPDLPATLAAPVTAAIDAHTATSLAAASEGDYVGTHWLASFALLSVDDI